MPNSEIPWKKMAVFDLNHGGLSIAKQLSKRGVRVTAFDTYNKMDLKKLQATEKFDFDISSDLTLLETEKFEIVCLPIHLSPENPFYQKASKLGISMISHHEIIGRMLRTDKRLDDINLIEITGIRGKTSTAVLLAQMLSATHTLLMHTSEGLTYWENGKVTMIEYGISIAPARVLDLIDMAFEKKCKPDTMIFEISLGYTGAQEIGVLTEIDPEYQIAGETMTSTNAKTKMISCSKEKSIFVVNYHDLDKIENYIRNDQEIVVYDDTGEAVEDEVPTDVYLNISELKDGQQTVDVESSRNDVYFRAEAADGYDIFSYRTALSASIAASLELGISEEQIINVIEAFRGVEGRMREYEEGTRLVMDNSNSGLTIETAETALNYMSEKYLDKRSEYYDSAAKRDIYLVIGEEEKTVCEGLEPTDIENLINNYEKEIHKVVFVGERLKTYMGKESKSQNKNEIIANAVFANTFKDGLKTALEYSENEDIIVAAVKCFR